MSKLVVAIGIIILIAVTGFVVAAIMSEPFRDSVYSSVEGSLLMPVHDSVVSTAGNIANSGFTYIAATSLALVAFGIFTGYAWSHWLRPRITIPFTQKSTGITQRDNIPQIEPPEPEVTRNPQPPAPQQEQI